MGRKSREKREGRSRAESTNAPPAARHTKRPGRRLPHIVEFSNPTVYRWLVTGASALATASVVYQGLFYQNQISFAALVVAIAALLWLTLHDFTIDLDWADITIVTLAVISVASYIWAANRNNAVWESGIWLAATLAYVMTRRTSQPLAILDGVLAGGGLLLLISLGEGLGLVDIPQWMLGSRLTYGLQYPDSAGALAFALGFLALWRRESVSGGWQPALMAMASAFWMGALLTQSRGALITVVPAGIVGLFFTRRPDMPRLLGRVGIVLLGAIAGTVLSLKSGSVLGLVVAVAIGAGAELLAQRAKLNARSVLVVCVVLVVLAGAAIASRTSRPVGLAVNSTFELAVPPNAHEVTVTLQGPGSVNVGLVAQNAYGTATTLQSRAFTLPAGLTPVNLVLGNAPKGTSSVVVDITLTKGAAAVVRANPSPPLLLLARVLPYSVYNRFATLSTSSISVWQRIVFIGNGLDLWIRSPIIGWGGGGWASTYRSVQSFGYTSLESHSSIVDVLDSYGIIGALLFIGFWYFAISGAIRNLRPRPGAGLALAAILSLLLHSLIDFDFSFLALVLVTFMMTGAVQTDAPRLVWRPNRWVPAVAVILAAAIAGTGFAGSQDLSAGQAAQAAGNTAQAQAAYLGATTWSPYSGTAWLDVAATQTSPVVAVSAVRRAYEDAPSDPTVLASGSNVAAAAHDFHFARALAERSIALAPNWSAPYFAGAEVDLTQATETLIPKGQSASAYRVLEKAQALLRRYNSVFASHSEYPASVNPGPGVEFLVAEGQVACLLGNVPEAIKALTSQTVTSSGSAALAAGWLYALGGVYAGQVPNMASLKATWAQGGLSIAEIASIQSTIQALYRFETSHP